MEKELKVCTYCEQEKEETEFYKPNRTHCIDCERTNARERMKRYNSTFRGRAMQALNDSRKAVRKVEAETGREIKNDLTFFDVAMVLNESECTYCGEYIEEQNRSLDHITPMRQGGDNTFSNVTMACRVDNSRKGDKPAFEYFIDQGVPYEEFELVVDRIARRKGISFGDAFKKLVDDMSTYYEAMLKKEKTS